jgi:two-component system response regulator VanR
VRVLIVDDSLEVLEVLELLLSEKFKVSKTSWPSEVLDLLKAQAIDLVISDLNMPEMDGIKLCQEVRKINQELPIILFTALDKELSHTLPLAEIKNILFVGDKDMTHLMEVVEKVSKRYTLPFEPKE